MDRDIHGRPRAAASAAHAEPETEPPGRIPRARPDVKPIGQRCLETQYGLGGERLFEQKRPPHRHRRQSQSRSETRPSGNG